MLAAIERTIDTLPPSLISPAYRLPLEGPGIVQPAKTSRETAELLLDAAKVSGKTAAEFRGPDFSSQTTGWSGMQARKKLAHGPPASCWRSHTALTHRASEIGRRQRA